MPSIHSGYEYDIFISYRQNDNKRDKWVTQFVDALKDELEATLKNPVSIYFDENPHDGLLETHQVDESLNKKLKALIFIPIISQTYCDTNSYAWQHEFLPFVQMAHNDELGMNITLRNGNVASRILPVQIHELDDEDQQLVEERLGGPLRSIPFIYKSKGVNRPLGGEEEHPQDNLDNIFYKDQINKVANALKEIGVAIVRQNQEQKPGQESIPKAQTHYQSTATNKNRKIVFFLGAVVIVALGYLWFKFNIQEKPVPIAEIDKSLVVLPFQDMSPNQDQEWFSDGLAEELLNRLSRVSELKLISRTTAFAFKGKGLTAKAIADSLGVTYVLEGSVRKANDQLRITAQLIKAEDDSHIWSNTYDYGMDSIFAVQEDISENITKVMNILLDENERNKMMTSGTKNVEAYEEYLKGNALFNKAHLEGIEYLEDANVHFEKAISLDPTFGRAYFRHQDLYSHHVLRDDEEILNDITRQEVYSRMMEDIDAAIKYSEYEDDILNYKLDKHYLSHDWDKLVPLVRTLKNKGFEPTGWTNSLFLIIDPEYYYDKLKHDLERDEFDERSTLWASVTLMNLARLDSALFKIQGLNDGKLSSIMVEALVYLRMGDYISALSVLNQLSTAIGGYQHTVTEVLAGRYLGGKEDLYRKIDSIGVKVTEMGESPIQIYNALGEYEKSDSAARIIDSKFLGHCNLIFNMQNYGLTFHLSATPNLSARLREIGIDPDEYEKEHYYQFPVVKLE